MLGRWICRCGLMSYKTTSMLEFLNDFGHEEMQMTFTNILDVINRHPDIELAYVFGSVAKGLATPDSDIDIAIKSSSPLTTETKIQLIEELAQTTGRAVDLIDLRKAGEPLVGEILHDGIRLKGSNSLHAELIKQHLFDVADFLPYVRRMLAERREKWTH
jgi:uncharacterized protein